MVPPTKYLRGVGKLSRLMFDFLTERVLLSAVTEKRNRKITVVESTLENECKLCLYVFLCLTLKTDKEEYSLVAFVIT